MSRKQKNMPVTLTAHPRECPAKLRSFIALKLNISGRKAKELLDARLVSVNGKRVWIAHHEIRRGDQVRVHKTSSPGKSRPDPEILYEDQDYAVVNKPPGIVSTGEDSMENTIQEKTGSKSVKVVHRLDRDTSGCLLSAKNTPAFNAAVELFRKKQVKKVYHAIAAGTLNPPRQTINIPLNGQTASTGLRTLNSNKEASHLQITIHTGRTHQIRRHLLAAGAPVLGDRRYSPGGRLPTRLLDVGRQMLHASFLEFIHPRTMKTVKVSSPLPRDFRKCLKQFKLS